MQVVILIILLHEEDPSNLSANLLNIAKKNFVEQCSGTVYKIVKSAHVGGRNNFCQDRGNRARLNGGEVYPGRC
jgi:hypothetical protein